MVEGKTTSDALKILHQRYYKSNPERLVGDDLWVDFPVYYTEKSPFFQALW
jgi:hypothetical protein